MIFFGKPFQPPRPEPKKAPPPPPKPKTLFEEKKHWKRNEFLRRTTKTPFKGYFGQHARKKLIQETFPHQRFGTHISKAEAQKRLKELRREELFAKDYSARKKAGKLRTYLEKETGLKA
jgi:hypothetical protein